MLRELGVQRSGVEFCMLLGKVYLRDVAIADLYQEKAVVLSYVPE